MVEFKRYTSSWSSQYSIICLVAEQFLPEQPIRHVLPSFHHSTKHAPLGPLLPDNLSKTPFRANVLALDFCGLAALVLYVQNHRTQIRLQDDLFLLALIGSTSPLFHSCSLSQKPYCEGPICTVFLFVKNPRCRWSQRTDPSRRSAPAQLDETVGGALICTIDVERVLYRMPWQGAAQLQASGNPSLCITKCTQNPDITEITKAGSYSMTAAQLNLSSLSCLHKIIKRKAGKKKQSLIIWLIFFLLLQTKPSFCCMFACSQLDFSAIPVSISTVSLTGRQTWQNVNNKRRLQRIQHLQEWKRHQLLSLFLLFLGRSFQHLNFE